MNCVVEYTDNIMVTVTESINQKPTEDVQEMASFKQEGSSQQECIGRSQKSVRLVENKVRLLLSQRSDRQGKYSLSMCSLSRDKNLRRLERRQGVEVFTSGFIIYFNIYNFNIKSCVLHQKMEL